MSRESNRAAFPKLAAVMDDVRAIWPDARVRFIEEGGKTLGAIPKPDEDTWGEIDGATYCHAMQQAEYLRTRKPKRGEA